MSLLLSSLQSKWIDCTAKKNVNGVLMHWSTLDISLEREKCQFLRENWKLLKISKDQIDHSLEPHVTINTSFSQFMLITLSC